MIAVFLWHEDREDNHSNVVSLRSDGWTHTTQNDAGSTQCKNTRVSLMRAGLVSLFMCLKFMYWSSNTWGKYFASNSASCKRNPSSDWLKWCALWSDVIPHLLLDQMSFPVVRQTGFGYVMVHIHGSAYQDPLEQANFYVMSVFLLCEEQVYAELRN